VNALLWSSGFDPAAASHAPPVRIVSKQFHHEGTKQLGLRGFVTSW
jgi:hypothetical protein